MGIEQQARLQQRQPYRKRFRNKSIGLILEISLLDQPHFFRRDVGELFLEGSLLKVGLLIGPREHIRNFDLSLLIDEDIMRPHVPNLPFQPRKILSAADETKQQIPQFLLLKVLTHSYPILDLLREQIWEVIIVNLY